MPSACFGLLSDVFVSLGCIDRRTISVYFLVCNLICVSGVSLDSIPGKGLNVSDVSRIAGVEIGGTKVAAMLWQNGDIIDQFRVPTSDPDTTFERLFAGLGRWWEASPFSALGVASFGPVTLDPLAKDFGCIRTTPKPKWTGTPVVPRLAARFDCPIGIETDVNAAALAEYQWGHGRGADSLVYLTIGTGVGGGILQGGRPLRGRLHPELGHLLLRRQPGDDFAGSCLFHRDCVEGLLSGPALTGSFPGGAGGRAR